MRILVAEDDPNIRSALCEIFAKEGYDVLSSADGPAALALFAQSRPDLVCLDVMMPGANGFDVCREIRKADPAVPIIFLTAKSEEIDKVLGLELGADDYIVKPFGMHEVVARVRAVTRRFYRSGSADAAGDEFLMADMRVVPTELRAFRGGEVIELSLREVRILGLFERHAGKVVTRDMLLDHCWGAHIMPESRTVDQHIANLRKKIERDGEPAIIRTVHGAGYKYEGGSGV